MGSATIGDANTPISQILDKAKKVGPGVTSASQFTATKTACSFVEVTAYEGNSAPMSVGGSLIVLGTAASSYTDRVGSGLVFPGQTKVYACTDVSLLYLSGLAADWVTWSILN